MNENQIKADAINNFVSTMIGAFESGFVGKNNPTLSEIHRVAHHYVNDNFKVELPTIIEQWGEDVAKQCGFNATAETKEAPNSEMIKWYLSELSCQDPETIESNEIEIYGEDEQGREGSCTAEITDIADKAYKRIIALENTLQKYAKYENKEAMERDIRLIG